MRVITSSHDRTKPPSCTESKPLGGVLGWDSVENLPLHATQAV